MGFRISAADSLTLVAAIAALTVAINGRRRPEVQADPASTAARLERELLGRKLGNVVGIRVGAATPDTINLGDGSRRILLVFRSSCPACARTNPYWRTMASRAGVEVLGLTAEPIGLGERYISGDSVAQVHVESELLRSWGITVVPVTIGVSSAGEVDLVQAGALDSVEMQSLVARIER